VTRSSLTLGRHVIKPTNRHMSLSPSALLGQKEVSNGNSGSLLRVAPAGPPARHQTRGRDRFIAPYNVDRVVGHNGILLMELT
jgi:hypothetical protein